MCSICMYWMKFWHIRWRNATYVTINLGEIYIADNIKEKSFGLDGRLDELLPALREACEA